MDTAPIRQKLYEYIRKADDKKVKAIYTIVENDLNELHEWWNDNDLIKELDNRSSDLKSGNDSGVSWDQLKKEIKNPTPYGL